MEELESIIECKIIPQRQIYNNEDFRIYACTTNDEHLEKNTYNNVSIKGIMPRLELGVEYTAQLEIAEKHPKYGVSYNCISIYQDVPTSVDDQKAFLKCLLTELQVKEIYNTYPDQDILKMIQENNFDYSKVKGLGEHTYNAIRNKIIENIEYKELLSRLGRYGINHSAIIQLTNKYNSKELAIQKVEDNPYILTSLDGIGFKKADVVARKMGFGFDHPFRIQSGIIYTIEQYQQEGHTYITVDTLLKNASDILEIESSYIQDQIMNTEGIVVEEQYVSLVRTYNAEKFIVKKLLEIYNNGSTLDYDAEEFIKRMEEKHKDVLRHGLTDQQKSFFHNLTKSSINLLVGFAGTSKSYLQGLLIELLEELDVSYILLSPTGKAAKVLSKYTSRTAQTIHKAIGYGEGKEIQQMIEINQELIIVDETSMVDVFIGAMTLGKITNPNAKILFLGDPFQLQSVGAGRLLHDLVESNVIPMTKLDIVFRQKESGLLDIMTKIRLGEKFVDDHFTGMLKFGDNMIIHCVDQDYMKDGYRNYYNVFLDMYKPEDIMVLSPTKKGELGTFAINQYIQSLVNPHDVFKSEYEFGEERLFRVGDYVINTKNMYEVENVDGELTNIVNGDTGIILDIITEGEKTVKTIINPFGEEEEIVVDNRGIVVELEDDTIKFSMNDLLQLLHSWCITCHKSQGSSSRAVEIIADKSHKFQLTANLIYTAGTRASEYCVILTQAETLNYAIRKVDNMRRNTRLQEFLKEAFKNNRQEM